MDRILRELNISKALNNEYSYKLKQAFAFIIEAFKLCSKEEIPTAYSYSIVFLHNYNEIFRYYKSYQKLYCNWYIIHYGLNNIMNLDVREVRSLIKFTIDNFINFDDDRIIISSVIMERFSFEHDYDRISSIIWNSIPDSSLDNYLVKRSSI